MGSTHGAGTASKADTSGFDSYRSRHNPFPEGHLRMANNFGGHGLLRERQADWQQTSVNIGSIPIESSTWKVGRAVNRISLLN